MSILSNPNLANAPLVVTYDGQVQTVMLDGLPVVVRSIAKQDAVRLRSVGVIAHLRRPGSKEFVPVQCYLKVPPTSQTEWVLLTQEDEIVAITSKYPMRTKVATGTFRRRR